MKKLSSLLLSMICLLSSVVVTACSKDKYEDATTTFKVVSNTISSVSGASVGVVKLTEGGFEFASSGDWCNLKKVDDTTLEVSLLENTSAEMRSCVITLTKGDSHIAVPVHQMGKIYGVESLASFALDNKGGEKRFAVTGDKAPEVKYNADWLQVRYEAGELIFTLAPMTNAASRSTNVEVRTELFSRTIKVSQRTSRDVLLGAYTLSYTIQYNQPRQTADVELAKRADGTFELRGLAVPVPVSIDEDTFAITIASGEMAKPQDITAANESLYLFLWAAGYPKAADGKPNYALNQSNFVGSWNNDLEHPSFTFADPRPNSVYKAIVFGIIRDDRWGGFYEGGNRLSSITDFSITKK